MQYVYFCGQVIRLALGLRDVKYRRISLIQAEQFSVVCIDHLLFILSCVDGYLSHFHLLAIVKNAVMDVQIQISL